MVTMQQVPAFLTAQRRGQAQRGEMPEEYHRLVGGTDICLQKMLFVICRFSLQPQKGAFCLWALSPLASLSAPRSAGHGQIREVPARTWSSTSCKAGLGGAVLLTACRRGCEGREATRWGLVSGPRLLPWGSD